MNSLFLVLLFPFAAQSNSVNSPMTLDWQQVSPLPDKEGFASAFAGVSGNSLIVAGGANFPNGFPWEGGVKKWYDSIFVLDQPNGTWRTATEKLPRLLGYGVSVTWNDSLICIGGSDQQRHYADVFSLRLEGEKMRITALPSLPARCANMCGCLVGSKVFVAGGTSSPEATEAMRTFWSLDLSLSSEKLKWQELEPWPGLDRSHAVAGTLNGEFYLMSGFRWQADEKGKPRRLSPFQTDAYRFTPGTDGQGAWRRLADLPRALGAAPTPAMAYGNSHIFIIGGIDDTVALPDPATYPGFRRDIHAYDVKADQWHLMADMPEGASRVTASTAIWHDRYLIINGERAPGRRSPAIFSIGIR